ATLGCRVPQLDAVLLIDDADGERASADQRLEHAVRCPQLFFGALALRDVEIQRRSAAVLCLVLRHVKPPAGAEPDLTGRAADPMNAFPLRDPSLVGRGAVMLRDTPRRTGDELVERRADPQDFAVTERTEAAFRALVPQEQPVGGVPQQERVRD